MSETTDGTPEPALTPEEVDHRIGALLSESVATGRKNKRRLRWLTWPLLFDILLTFAIFGMELNYQHDQRVQCRRFNETRAGELALWEPLLAAPRAPLKPNATAEEKAAYDQATVARNQFERSLHKYFDPVDC